MQLTLPALWKPAATGRSLKRRETEVYEETQSTRASSGGSASSQDLGITLEDVVEQLQVDPILDRLVNHSFFTTARLACASTRLRRGCTSTGIQTSLHQDLSQRCAGAKLRSIANEAHIDPDKLRVMRTRCGIEALVSELCIALQKALHKADERRGIDILKAFVEGGVDIGLSLPPACVKQLRLLHARQGDTLLTWLLRWEAALRVEVDGGVTQKTLRSFLRNMTFWFPRSRSQHVCQGAACACGSAAVPCPPPRKRRRS